MCPSVDSNGAGIAGGSIPHLGTLNDNCGTGIAAVNIFLETELFKSIVQRILRGVNTKLKKSVLVNWRPAQFSF
jgi:hypothetical protein